MLGVEHVGVHDDFFDLGGNSLAAAQVMARVQDADGPGLSLGAILEAPTIAELASVLESQSEKARR